MEKQIATGTQAKIDHGLIFHQGQELYMLLQPNPPEFTILDASESYLKATLTTREKIIGRGLFTVFPDNPNDETSNATANLRKSLGIALEQRQTHVMAVQKYDVPLPDGSGFEEKFWNPKNTPIYNDKQELLYVLHHAEDVTEAVQLEIKRKNEIRFAAEMLEEKSVFIRENEKRISLILEALLKYTTMDFSKRLAVTDKGDQLDAIVVGINSLIDELESNINLLKRSNNALEHANRELDSFSYSVSHDLRAPLRGINGYAQVLLEDYADKLDEEGRKNIEVIMKNALKMGNLIDDLLTFSRLGKQNVSKAPLNMDHLVSGVLKDMRSSCDKANIELKPLSPINGDYNMMVQVMTNLISNALKYSSKKQNPKIEIGCFEKEDKMVYYVKDNGAGFDMKYYDKLFGVFQRLHGPSEFEGTGVGLALVQRVIRKHEGEIWAEAIPGEGATFSFSLPTKTNSDKNGEHSQH